MKVTDYYNVLTVEEAKHIFFIKMREEKLDFNLQVAATMKFRDVSQKEAEWIVRFVAHSNAKADKLIREGGK